jgi:hypothetical protein
MEELEKAAVKPKKYASLQVVLHNTKNQDLIDFIEKRTAKDGVSATCVSREIMYIGMHMIREMELTQGGRERLTNIKGSFIHKI